MSDDCFGKAETGFKNFGLRINISFIFLVAKKCRKKWESKVLNLDLVMIYNIHTTKLGATGEFLTNRYVKFQVVILIYLIRLNSSWFNLVVLEFHTQ